MRSDSRTRDVPVSPKDEIPYGAAGFGSVVG
jgi:hypothetical protein